MRRLSKGQGSADEIEKFEVIEISIASEELVGSIRPLIEPGKARVAQSVNSEPVLPYWQIGKSIREKYSARKNAGQDFGRKRNNFATLQVVNGIEMFKFLGAVV